VELLIMLLAPFPLGYFIHNRMAAYLAYVAVHSFVFTFQSTSLLKEWVGGDHSAFATNPAAVDWPYGLVNLAHLRRRPRAGRPRPPGRRQTPPFGRPRGRSRRLSRDGLQSDGPRSSAPGIGKRFTMDDATTTTMIKAVSIMELRDGKVVRERIYYGEPWEPPAWRAQWVEAMEKPA
jgi:hypothetical protein